MSAIGAKRTLADWERTIAFGVKADIGTWGIHTKELVTPLLLSMWPTYLDVTIDAERGAESTVRVKA